MATCMCVTGRLNSANTGINIVLRLSRQCSRTLISWLIVLHVSFFERRKQNGCQDAPFPPSPLSVATASRLCTGAAVHQMTSLDFTCSVSRRSPSCKANLTEVRFNGCKSRWRRSPSTGGNLSFQRRYKVPLNGAWRGEARGRF